MTSDSKNTSSEVSNYVKV